jgi:pyruvate-formate lyase-activating enzyme
MLRVPGRGRLAGTSDAADERAALPGRQAFSRPTRGCAFLGGEPLLQLEFLAVVLDRVLLGTSGCASGEDWRRVVGHAIFLFLDLKLIKRPNGVTRGVTTT